MVSALVWLALGLIGLAYEMFTLVKEDDDHHPLTYYVRRLIKSPVGWAVAAAWGWATWHFFVQQS